VTRLHFRLPLPPSANNLFPTSQSGHRFPSQRYKAWRERAAVAFAESGCPRTRLTGPVIVLYEFSFGDRRRRDVFNYEKAVSDFLVSQGLIEDDCDIVMGIVCRVEGAEWFGVRVTARSIGKDGE
jgi:crossover junction endodeoxyribonuclease RusA